MAKEKEIAISIKDIHKEFILPQSKNTSLKQAAVNIVKKNNKVRQKVLDGVSFDIHKGDFFGIVGRNGSGKSTLLKLIAGVYYPTSGSIEVNGGLTPFIELGVGFNPELSGRDNVFLNGALLGFTREQVAKMYDDIVDFAELGPFMDQKLKNYSSGMQVRLAFSIAIKAKNDILIFDEVLAVGDEAFQRKCLDVFERYKAEDQTVVLVTHDMETVRQYCNRAALISEGKLKDIGNPQKIADDYSRLNQVSITQDIVKEAESSRGVVAAELRDATTGEVRVDFETGQDALLELSWNRNNSIDAVVVDIFKTSGEHVSGFKSIKDGVEGIGEVQSARVKIKLNIAPGSYYFQVSLRDADDEEIATVYKVARFIVTKNWQRSGTAWSGLVPLEHTWTKVE